MGTSNLKTSEIIIQTLATVIISLLSIQTGIVNVWPSYNVANFVSNDTVLSSSMSSVQISLLGSLMNIGGLIAMPFCSWVFSVLGRKYGTMLFSVPYVICWSIIALSNEVTLVLLAVTIAGIGVSGQNVATMFISEIAQDKIRGALTSCSYTGCLLGFLISDIMGGYMEYKTIVIINLISSVITLLLLALLPESPLYLVLVGKEEEAAKSISFYRCLDVKSKEVEFEIRKLRLSTDPRLENITQEIERDFDLEIAEKLVKKLDKDAVKRKLPEWKLLLTNQSSKRALTTVVILISLSNFMGCNILLVFAEPLFTEAIPSMSSNKCSIFLFFELMIASLFCVTLIDRFGRKHILLVTSAGSCISIGLLGLQVQLHFGPDWITVAFAYMYGFIFNCGCSIIPLVLAAEVFLPEVRSLCYTLCFASFYISNFITLFVFLPLVNLFGLSCVLYILSFMCFICTIYAQFYLPETKNLSVDAIQTIFLPTSR